MDSICMFRSAEMLVGFDAYSLITSVVMDEVVEVICVMLRKVGILEGENCTAN